MIALRRSLPLWLLILLVWPGPGVAADDLSSPAKQGAAEAPQTAADAEVPINVVADKLTVFHRDNRASFEGRVVVTADETVIHCQRLDVTYDDDGRIDTLRCEGEVRILRGDREALGETALFMRNPDRIQLMGNPVVREPRGEMRGQEIWLYLGDDRVEVQQAQGSFRMPGITGGTR